MHNLFVLKTQEDGLQVGNAQPAVRERQQRLRDLIHLDSL
jgi:hypothetical protein